MRTGICTVDISRCHCGGERKVIAALTRGQSPDALRRYLDHMGEPADPLPISPARAHVRLGGALPESEFALFSEPLQCVERSSTRTCCEALRIGLLHFVDRRSYPSPFSGLLRCP